MSPRQSQSKYLICCSGPTAAASPVPARVNVVSTLAFGLGLDHSARGRYGA